MAAGEKTIKIKITGDAKGLSKATKDAEKDIASFASKISNGIKNVTSKLPDMLSGVIGSLPPQGQAIALALVGGLTAALAPLIGAAISTAVLLAVGGGILALGIKSAISDPKVSKAFDGLKKKASQIFKDFGKPFVDPMVRAAKTIGKVLDDLKPQILQLGKIMAPVIDKLSPALAAFFRAVMPGITRAVSASVPLFNVLAEKLPKVGQAIGIFFDEISANSDDTTQFFSDMIDVVSGVIVGLGRLIGWLTSFYSAVRSSLGNAKSAFLQFTLYLISLFGRILNAAVASLGWIPGLGSKLRTAQAQFHSLQVYANSELKKIKDRQIKINVWSNVASVVGQVGKILSGVSGVNVGKRAMGGPVASGRSYLVGERGPELLTMGGNGYVTPNNKLGSSGSSQPVIQVFIGEKELEQIAYNVVQQNNRQLKRQLQVA